MSIRKDFNDLVRDRWGRTSLSRLLLLTGMGLILIATALIVDRILNLPDPLFVQSLTAAVLLLGGITTLLGALAGWKSWLDAPDDPEKPAAPKGTE